MATHFHTSGRVCLYALCNITVLFLQIWFKFLVLMINANKQFYMTKIIYTLRYCILSCIHLIFRIFIPNEVSKLELSATDVGWLELDVSNTVLEWMRNPLSNQGLSIKVFDHHGTCKIYGYIIYKYV